jgi:hypothetical protein
MICPPDGLERVAVGSPVAFADLADVIQLFEPSIESGWATVTK